MKTPPCFLPLLFLLCAAASSALADPPKADPAEPPFDIKEHYTKYEYRIPMRDGVRLFTAVYVPKEHNLLLPFLILRTPYSVAAVQGDEHNYGPDQYPGAPRHLGPSEEFDKAGYIFVFQDVRGRFLSEGKWDELRPHLDDKKSPQDTDESSDMHDTVDWLLKNVPKNNGRVGIWGISYPGFFTSASIIDSHPAIKAASPQAPVTDFYMGDDVYHGGAHMLSAEFDFYKSFKTQHNPTPEPRKWEDFEYGTQDAYEYFLRAATLGNLAKTFTDDPESDWLKEISHDTYDDYWKTRNIAPHLKNIHCAVLTVGGWFDAEDLQGPFTVYHSIGQNNPGIFNGLVIGPWVHGGWGRTMGHRLGRVDFAADTGEYYRKKILFPFFEQYLKLLPEDRLNDPVYAPVREVMAFETGTNVWRAYKSWPPEGARPRTLYFQPNGGLGWEAPGAGAGSGESDEYVSNPNKPVPYIAYTTTDVPKEYMVSDQRFAATRPDVLTYQTPPLEEDVTVAGPISPKLFVSTTGTDSDWVVKLIDVYPPDFAGMANNTAPAAGGDVPPPADTMAGYQQLVRGEPLRGKFRHSFEKPEPFTPGKVEAVNFTMPDVDHTFRRGHRIMVQVQSSWFPLIDRNPQVFLRIPDAKPEDFKSATQHIYRTGEQPSGVTVQVLDPVTAAGGMK